MGYFNNLKYINNQITSDSAIELTWNFILENNIASVESLELITNINGYNIETLNQVIHANTAYHDIKQLYDCERDCFYFDDEIIDNIESIYFNQG